MIDKDLNSYVHIYEVPDLMLVTMEYAYYELKNHNFIEYFSIWREGDLRAAGCLDSKWY